LALYSTEGLFQVSLDTKGTIDVKDTETLEKLVLLGLRQHEDFTPYDEIEKDCNL
jgi:hypothetical protein